MSQSTSSNSHQSRNSNDLDSKSETDRTHQTDNKPIILNKFFRGTVATEQQFKNRLSELADNTQAPVSVYLHIPFSPYQLLTDDTVSVANNGSQDVSEYIDAVEREIEQITQRVGSNRLLTQLHLGGNAPNSISQKHIVRIQDILERHFKIDETTETSVVADPGRTSFAQMELLNGLGFRQINYGICDFDAGVQATIGRVQSPELIRESFQASREAGFECITSDLLYGIPNQTVAGMQSTIEHYLDIQPDRIICRCYNNNAANSSDSHSPKNLPSLADKMATFHAVVDGLTSQGYEWVGLDCFARVGDTLTSGTSPLRRNRIGYSTAAPSDTLGFGSNAISEVGGVWVQNHAGIDQWSAALDDGGLGVARGIRLSGESLKRRNAMADLMCNMETNDGASLLSNKVSEQQMRQYERDGVLEISGDHVKVTSAGQFFLSQLWEDVLPNSLRH